MSQRPRTKGLDASRWQAGIDFPACRAAGPITDVNEYEGTLEQLRAEVTFNG